ncbi:Similar to Senp1: Sentrin-specific protease 1 (Mus musculus) [Cotesia congregata]|uniref:Similar to Senp1: Sentrin-specific protease 1 (Mus musculus) n=1 Tax=Cotesia congregata TaxID=51543 RepID=A0A8J2HUJ8_COTCN|nr:Similar to Senp1: Sentrin-specific protease 1 (Mus musculus) [Cotesia congregata]
MESADPSTVGMSDDFERDNQKDVDVESSQTQLNCDELINSEIIMDFTDWSTDISLQEVIINDEAFAYMVEDDNFDMLEYENIVNALNETLIEKQSPEPLNEELQAAVESIKIYNEISGNMSHIIEEEKKLLSNFFRNNFNNKCGDKNESSIGTTTIDSLLKLHKEHLGDNDEHLFTTNVGMNIRVMDLKKLVPPNKLNDEVINLYLKIISNVSLVDTYVFDTHFYPQLNKGFTYVEKWTKNVDILAKNIIFIPIHLGNHWTLCVVDVTDSTIWYYDSLGGKNEKTLNIIETYLTTKEKQQCPKEYSAAKPRKWAKKHAKNIPLQNNDYDCGVFVCYYAKQLSMLKPITNINTANMKPFRTLMLQDILETYEPLSPSANDQNKQLSEETIGVYLYQSANYHQGSLGLFTHQQTGLQCTAIATYAIAALPNQLSNVTAKDLDDILIGGDKYYLQCRVAASEDMLNIDELLSNILIKNQLVVMAQKNDVCYGSLVTQNPLSCLYTNIIQKVLPKIEKNSGFLFITQGKTVAFKYLNSPHSNEQHFFLFNSHSVDKNNCLVENNTNGKAQLFQCCGPLALAKALLAGANLNCEPNNSFWGIYQIKFSINT